MSEWLNQRKFPAGLGSVRVQAETPHGGTSPHGRRLQRGGGGIHRGKPCLRLPHLPRPPAFQIIACLSLQNTEHRGLSRSWGHQARTVSCCTEKTCKTLRLPQGGESGDVPQIKVSHLGFFAPMKFDAAHITYTYITDTEALSLPTSAPSSVPFCIAPLSLSPRARPPQSCYLLLLP